MGLEIDLYHNETNLREIGAKVVVSKLGGCELRTVRSQLNNLLWIAIAVG